MDSPKIEMNSVRMSHWSESDIGNVEKVIEFVQLIMNDHNFEAVRQQYSGNPYTQHNRNIADGIEGVIKTVSDLVNNAPEFSYDVKRVLVDGEFVSLHSHATLKAAHRGDDTQGMNIVDTWKVVDGQLVEHWDAIQGISFSMRFYSLIAGGKVRNSNGVF